MTTANRMPWYLCVILVGVLYGFVGIGFALPTNYARFWRFAAWAVSGAIYLSQIGYEQFWLRKSKTATAMHAALAAAVGGFVLAVGAFIHATTARDHAPYWRYAIALVAWPIITGVPALLIGLVVTALLATLQPKSDQTTAQS
jgi:hypothetical protein